jgi:NAD(P)-dependent dehydrogenase (short-subunit alcohol dehydrogenase family)
MAEHSLAGKAVLVCGITSGIGEATVRRLAGSRARVTFVGRREVLGEVTAGDLRRAGHQADFVAADMTVDVDDPCSVRRPAQLRLAVTIQARESNQIPSPLACAASVSRSRSSARSAATGSSRFSTSFVHVKLRTQSSAAATSGP